MTRTLSGTILMAMLLSLAPTWRDAQVHAGNETVHTLTLQIGRSHVVQAQWPIKRVSIANPTVADFQLLSPTEVLVVGNAVGVTDLYLWNEAGDSWRAEVHVDMDLSRLEAELREYFPTAELKLGRSNDVVVVRGLLRRAEDVGHLEAILKSTLDDPKGEKWVNMTSLAGVQQVLVKIRVAEASRNATRSLGVDVLYNGQEFFGFSRPGGLISASSTVGSRVESFSFPQSATLFGFFPQADLNVLVEALVDNQYMRILAEPSLVALSGEEASFLAGGEFPIPVVQGGGGGASGGTSISIEFKEFGVRLSFRPTVLGDGRIRVKVAPEVSELSNDGAVQIEGFTVPAIRTRRAETTLEMNSGQSFVLAGLLNRNVMAGARKVPGIGQMPIIGTLFRSVRYERGDTELIAIATVELVEPVSVTGDRAMPGDDHVEPNDWELYFDGRLHGRGPAPISSGKAQVLKDLGVGELRGPGAWANHSDRP